MSEIDIVEDIFESLIYYLKSVSTGMLDAAYLKIQHCELADKDHKEDPRVYAHVGCEPSMICVSAAMAQDFNEGKLNVQNVKGILIHEIGHVLHDRYHEHMQLPDTSDPEILADSTVHLVFKLRILYDHRKVQWVDLD